MNWVGQGQYSIAIGAEGGEIESAIAKGIPLAYLPGDLFKEGTYVTPASNSLSVVKGAPHTDATKVFLDWLLSKEGSTAWVKGSGYPSLRQDVPHDRVPDYMVLKPNVQYQNNALEEYVNMRQEIADYLNTIIPK